MLKFLKLIRLLLILMSVASLALIPLLLVQGMLIVIGMLILVGIADKIIRIESSPALSGRDYIVYNLVVLSVGMLCGLIINFLGLIPLNIDSSEPTETGLLFREVGFRILLIMVIIFLFMGWRRQKHGMAPLK